MILCHNLPTKCVAQHVADNVDQSIYTLDGKFTFHGMRLSAASTPIIPERKHCIPRVKVCMDDIKCINTISIVYKRCANSIFCKILHEEIVSVKAENPYTNQSLLWSAVGCFKDPRPLWSRTMQTMLVGEHPGKASMFFLPMIDMPATDDDLRLLHLTFRSITSSEIRLHSCDNI